MTLERPWGRPAAPGSGTDAPAGPARRRIVALDERTVREIAAGEVIERPASVVKELVENSLDAGAGEVRVRVEGGGLERLEVTDDGGGISPEDLPLAFERHATSKLSSASDLPSVRTLGFRGEALASIAAVSEVEITSRVPGAPEARSLSSKGGRLGEVRPAARAPGTTVEVRGLFFNTPARRKFLKSETTESLRIIELIEGLYLAHPGTTFSLRVGERAETRYALARSLREAAARVFGAPFLTGAFDFQGAAGPGLWVEGVASHPSFSRGTARGIVLCVDGRVISSKPLQDGVRFAYHEVLPQGRFPVVVLHLTTEPGRVDVNVHPTKREVRFERESEVREALQNLIRAKLRDQPRGLAPPVRGAFSPPRTLGTLTEGSGSLGAVPWRPASGASSPLASPTSAPLSPPSPPTLALSSTSPPGVGPSGPRPPRPLDDGSVAGAVVVAGTSVHPPLRLLGQVGDLYLVGETLGEDLRPLPGPSRSIVLIDAHAASERILYERLRSSETPARQELLSPFEVDPTPRQRAALESYGGELAKVGFSLEPFGPRVLRVHAVPYFRGHRARPDALVRLLDELADGGRTSPGDPLWEKVAKTTACHLAIRGGDVLTLPEMQKLLEELYSCPESFTCPHGRPILLTLPRDRLDRWFLRP